MKNVEYEVSENPDKLEIAASWALEMMDEKIRIAVIARYGLTGPPMTFKEIGKVFHTCRERARQIVNTGIRRTQKKSFLSFLRSLTPPPEIDVLPPSPARSPIPPPRNQIWISHKEKAKKLERYRGIQFKTHDPNMERQ